MFFYLFFPIKKKVSLPVSSAQIPPPQPWASAFSLNRHHKTFICPSVFFFCPKLLLKYLLMCQMFCSLLRIKKNSKSSSSGSVCEEPTLPSWRCRFNLPWTQPRKKGTPTKLLAREMEKNKKHFVLLELVICTLI